MCLRSCNPNLQASSPCYFYEVVSERRQVQKTPVRVSKAKVHYETRSLPRRSRCISTCVLYSRSRRAREGGRFMTRRPLLVFGGCMRNLPYTRCSVCVTDKVQRSRSRLPQVNPSASSRRRPVYSMVRKRYSNKGRVPFQHYQESDVSPLG